MDYLLTDTTLLSKAIVHFYAHMCCKLLAHGKDVFPRFIIVNGSFVVSSIQVLLHFPLDYQVA